MQVELRLQLSVLEPVPLPGLLLSLIQAGAWKLVLARVRGRWGDSPALTLTLAMARAWAWAWTLALTLGAGAGGQRRSCLMRQQLLMVQ
jgi:hypothetical protein